MYTVAACVQPLHCVHGAKDCGLLLLLRRCSGFRAIACHARKLTCRVKTLGKLIRSPLQPDALANAQGLTQLENCVAWSPDGKQLAGGADDHAVHIWDVTNGTCTATLEVRTIHTSTCRKGEALGLAAHASVPSYVITWKGLSPSLHPHLMAHLDETPVHRE